MIRRYERSGSDFKKGVRSMSEQKDTAERKKKLLDLVKQLSELSEEDLYFLIGYLEGKCKYKEVDGRKGKITGRYARER